MASTLLKAAMSIDLWKTRADSLAHLQALSGNRLGVAEEVLVTIDMVIDAFEESAAADEYHRVCGITLLKAKQLGFGAYSLLLDGLGQEAGALLRPFIEYKELLTFFTKFPDKVQHALDQKLPSAGKRAAQIDGDYRGLREFLNTTAAHSSYSDEALRHLIEPGGFRFKKYQVLIPKVLEENFRMLVVMLYLLLIEGTRALDQREKEVVTKLAPRIDGLKAKIISAFELERPRPQ